MSNKNLLRNSLIDARDMFVNNDDVDIPAAVRSVADQNGLDYDEMVSLMAPGHDNPEKVLVGVDDLTGFLRFEVAVKTLDGLIDPSEIYGI